MSRPMRIQFPGAVYHVMNRGALGTQQLQIPTAEKDLG